MQLIYYVRTERRFVSSHKDQTSIGIFVWPAFPALDEHGEFKVYKEMRIELDLDGRSFHQGWLTHQSGEVWPLTAAQACMHLGSLNLITWGLSSSTSYYAHCACLTLPLHTRGRR